MKNKGVTLIYENGSQIFYSSDHYHFSIHGNVMLVKGAAGKPETYILKRFLGIEDGIERFLAEEFKPKETA